MTSALPPGYGPSVPRMPITSPRYGMVLPTRPERVQVMPLTEAFLRLDEDSAHQGLPNTFTVPQTFDADVTVTGRTTTATLTLRGPTRNVEPVTVLAADAAGTVGLYERTVVVPPQPQHWVDNGTNLLPSAGAGNRGVEGATLLAHGWHVYLEGSRAVHVSYNPDLGGVQMSYGNGVFTPGVTVNPNLGVWWEGILAGRSVHGARPLV